MQRKEFIKVSAGLAGLSLLNPLSVTSKTAGSAFVKPKINISLKYGMVEGNMSVLDKFQMLKDIGFDGVEMDSPNNLNNDEIIEALGVTILMGGGPSFAYSTHVLEAMEQLKSAEK